MERWAIGLMVMAGCGSDEKLSVYDAVPDAVITSHSSAVTVGVRLAATEGDPLTTQAATAEEARKPMGAAPPAATASATPGSHANTTRGSDRAAAPATRPCTA